jgi:uncharacterized membrane protein
LLAAAGLLCAVILEVVHIRTYTDPSAGSFCSASAAVNCASVALSRYSIVLGVPVPIWGIVAFVVLLVAALRESSMLVPLSGIAAVASVVLLAVEVVAIHSVCLLCEGVHVASWALFAVAWQRRATFTPPSRDDWIRVVAWSATALIATKILLPPYWGLYSWRAGVHLPHGVEADGNEWIGAETPRFVVHEYVDYGCPHCALSATKMRRLLASHPTAFRVVRHQYPRMSCHKLPGGYACQFARAAICAGQQGHFWEMDSWLFEHAPGKASVDTAQAARDVALDAPRFLVCVDDVTTYAQADAADRQATKDHIVDAPTYVIDGKRYVSGKVFPALESLL